MTKLVVIKLDGDVSQEVRVTLEIGSEGERASIEMAGFLPPAPEMTQVYDQWKDVYYRLGTEIEMRLTHEKTTIDGEITPQKCLENAEVVRSHLNEWLRSPGFVPLWEKCLQQLQPDEEVRVLIRTSSEALQKLPWQLWELIEKYPKAEVALSATGYDQPTFRPHDRNQIKILAILGDSTGINVDEDRKLLENNLPYAKTTFLVEPQREEISDQLWEQSWDILFFAGHSRSEGETGRIYINKTESLSIDELKSGLENAIRNGGLQLAIFNSCDGQGLARALQRLQIPQMIVMREPVPDLVAQRYLKYLLNAFIIEDKSLYLAERKARKRLEDLENTFPCASWLPVIYQHPAVVPPTRDQLGGISNNSSTVQGKGTQLTRQERCNRQDLLTKVKKEVASRLRQLLPEALSIKLHKEKQPQQVAPYWDVDAYASGRTTPLPPNTEIIDLFDKEADGKLLILGTPGSGKTITLLELARDLIPRAEFNPDKPIPVLLNLSSWKDNNQTIAQWVLAELKSNLGVPQNIGKRWLKNRQLLLLLDGLDELKERQLLCIEAINRFEQDNRLQPIVVCTRLEEYELCRIKLQLNEAICLKPLNPNQIQQYLELAGHSQLWHSIQDDRSLRELAKSPLLLWMMMSVSQEISSGEWQRFNFVEEFRKYLFNTYIGSKLQQNNRQTYYASGKEPTPEKTQRWLSYLAKMFEKEAQTEFLIETMQPYWLQNPHQKRLYRIGIGLITGLIVGFSFALGSQLIQALVVELSEGPMLEVLWGLILSPFVAVRYALSMGLLGAMIGWLCKGRIYSPIGGLILGVICEGTDIWGIWGSLVGLLAGICVGFADKIRILEWSWSRAKRGIVYWVIGSGSIGIIVGLYNDFSKISTLYIKLNNARLIGNLLNVGLLNFLFCSLTGLFLGLLFSGIISPSIDLKTRTIPNQGIWQSLSNARIYALIWALLFCLIHGLQILSKFMVPLEQFLYNKSSTSIVINSILFYFLKNSLTFGFFGGMIQGFACIQHFSLRSVLCWRGLIPWNYARFLNYATEKRLLQKVGGRYRYFHVLLQEHFAQMPLN